MTLGPTPANMSFRTRKNYLFYFQIELQIWIHNHHQSTVLDGERVVGAELDAGQCYTFHQAVPSFRFSPNSKTYDLHMAHYYETDCVR